MIVTKLSKIRFSSIWSNKIIIVESKRTRKCKMMPSHIRKRVAVSTVVRNIKLLWQNKLLICASVIVESRLCRPLKIYHNDWPPPSVKVTEVKEDTQFADDDWTKSFWMTTCIQPKLTFDRYPMTCAFMLKHWKNFDCDLDHKSRLLAGISYWKWCYFVTHTHTSLFFYELCKHQSIPVSWCLSFLPWPWEHHSYGTDNNKTTKDANLHWPPITMITIERMHYT